jgi:phosphate:Na+ symporter
MQGILTYDVAVYLVIGAAIGSVTPNLLASLTTNRNGKRTAVLNLIFNIIRAIILLILISLVPQLLDMIQALSPDDIGRQIANTHTIFAIIAVVILLPFTNKLIWIVEKLIPVLPEENEQIEDRKLQYIANLKNMPVSFAISQTHLEITRMGRIAAKNLNRSLECFFDYDPDKAERVRKREESVDILNSVIAEAMLDLRAMELSQENIRRISMMNIAITDMERFSDHAENIVEYAETLTNKKVWLTEAAEKELRQMAADTLQVVDMSLDIFETEDYSKLDEIERIEDKIDRQETKLVNNHVARFVQEQCDPLAGVVFTDIVTDLERCGDNAINVAYALKGPKPVEAF